MQVNELTEITRVLQTAISPVAMISGIGLLVLAMTNRFAHTTDRTRQLAKQSKTVSAEENEHLSSQIRILYYRLRIQLLAISLALASLFFVSLLITALFGIYLFNINLHGLVIALFVLSLLSLVLSLSFFIRDMTLSLRALKDELRDHI
ncbi:MAG: DUF2721 domain-containing protein [Acidobacteria bacterium]|nr:DUF2721 domain-containing protein [Acidobacteriota bacterium]